MVGGWDGVDEFVAVARGGSFTAGARSFGASVTHMSRTVARLEGRLGAQLFNRTTRSVYLTETGKIFFDRCQRLVDEREDAIAGIASQGAPSGNLRVTCSYALGEQFIAPLIREFALQHPALSVELDLDNGIVDIVSRDYDLAVRTGHLEDSRLIATRVAQRELVTVASRHYLSSRGEPYNVADLVSHDCLVGSSQKWHFRRGQTYRPRGRWRCNSGSTVVEACLAGMGNLPTARILCVQASVGRAASGIAPRRKTGRRTYLGSLPNATAPFTQGEWTRLPNTNETSRPYLNT